MGRVDGKVTSSEPKTARSRRTVPLSPAVVAMLKRHKVDQAAERLRAGERWTDSGLVFGNEFGGSAAPNYLLRTIKAAAARAGVEESWCTH